MRREYTITTIRNILEADEALQRIVRTGLFRELQRNIDDIHAWDKVIHTLARHGARLVMITYPPLWGSVTRYKIIKTHHYISNINNVEYGRLRFLAGSQRLNWPLTYVTHTYNRDTQSHTGPLRNIEFDYEVIDEEH